MSCLCPPLLKAAHGLCLACFWLSLHPAYGQELAAVHLTQVQKGELPSQFWFPEDRPAIDDVTDSMNGLVQDIGKLDGPALLTIKRAHADRSVIVRDLHAPNLRQRIDRVCETHQPLIERLQLLPWANPSDDLVPFEFVPQRYQVQSISYLVNLYAVREFSLGRVESASKTLAGGFAFAHNLMQTSGDINMLMGVLLQSVMTNGIADLQAMGAPDMQNVLRNIAESQLDQQTIDRMLWQSVCQSMPLLIDRPRTPQEWLDDARATLRTFHRDDLTPESPEEAEQFGRQVQTIVQLGNRARTLRDPVKYEHGGLLEVKELQPGQQLRISLTLNIPALAEYVEKSLDGSICDRSRSELHQRLNAIECIELLRRESVKRGHWLTNLDDELTHSIPVQQGTSKRPTVTVVSTVNQLPGYEIRFAAGLLEQMGSSFSSKTVAVFTEQELSK
jgi:hypothetical protein